MSQTLSNLPIGARIKFGKHKVNKETAWDIVWKVVAKNHQCEPGYPNNSVTLFAEKAIDARIFDAEEPRTSDDSGRDKYGNSRYLYSNIRQWLNSDAAGNKWYTAQHPNDAPPDSSTGAGEMYYAARPGFLSNFSNDEKSAILNTTNATQIPLSDVTDEVYLENIIDKVFLPSALEIGLANSYEGATWEYFAGTNNSIMATLTDQAYANIVDRTWIPETVSKYVAYFTRTYYPTSQYLKDTYVLTGVSNGWGDLKEECIANSNCGIRPAINLSASLLISDTTDGDGCYTVSPGTAPTAPEFLNVPSTVYGGLSASISWGESEDAEGNLSGYILERSYDGGAFIEIFRGNQRTYTDSITYGITTVQYRVCAYDTSMRTSPYTTSAVRNVINNSPPVISGTDGWLGTKDNEFLRTYVVTDADSDEVRIIEAVDGVQVRSYVATLGRTEIFNVKGETWMRLSNGSHTMTITATDTSGNSTVRTYNFTKSINSFSVMNTVPYESTTRPSRIKLSITRNIPAEASFVVYVCNNGYDNTPTWEDATDSVIGSIVHVFENTTKTNELWGVKVRVEVARGAADGPCYVSQIGGNFE